MAKHEMKSKQTGFTADEVDALSRIYDVADAADRGSVYINNLGGNLAWRLRGTPELVELFSILERRFGGIDSDSVNWDLVEAIRLARQAKQDRILRRIQAACRERLAENRKERKS
jgi:hypothetical protein